MKHLAAFKLGQLVSNYKDDYYPILGTNIRIFYTTEQELEAYRKSYALCMLLKEGVDSNDENLQEDIALFLFYHYPLIIQCSALARWYLPFILEHYEPFYVFLKTTVSLETPHFKHISNDVRWKSGIVDSETKDRRSVRDLLGKFSYSKGGYVFSLEGKEYNIPTECIFSEKTCAELKLSSNVELEMCKYIFRQLASGSTLPTNPIVPPFQLIPVV